MTLYEFNSLDEMEQIEVVWDAVKIAERNEGDIDISLYAQDDFYIEVHHDRVVKVYRKIRTFKNSGPLEKYLPGIDISELL